MAKSTEALPLLWDQPLEVALEVAGGVPLLNIHNQLLPGLQGVLQVPAQVEGTTGHAVQKTEDLEASLNPGWEWAVGGKGSAQEISKWPGLGIRPRVSRGSLFNRDPKTAQQVEVLSQLLKKSVPPEEVTVDRVQMQRCRHSTEGMQHQFQCLAGGHCPPCLQWRLMERSLQIREQGQKPVEPTGDSECRTAFGGL